MLLRPFYKRKITSTSLTQDNQVRNWSEKSTFCCDMVMMHRFQMSYFGLIKGKLVLLLEKTG